MTMNSSEWWQQAPDTSWLDIEEAEDILCEHDTDGKTEDVEGTETEGLDWLKAEEEYSLWIE